MVPEIAAPLSDEKTPFQVFFERLRLLYGELMELDKEILIQVREAYAKGASLSFISTYIGLPQKEICSILNVNNSRLQTTENTIQRGEDAGHMLSEDQRRKLAESLSVLGDRNERWKQAVRETVSMENLPHVELSIVAQHLGLSVSELRPILEHPGTREQRVSLRRRQMDKFCQAIKGATGTYPTVKELMTEFAVSRLTIKRDLEALGVELCPPKGVQSNYAK